MINKIEEKFTLRNGVNYKEMFSGGILIYQCPIINEKNHGVASYYNINQEKVKEVIYDNGKRTKETHFLNDKKHGYETTWGMGSEKTVHPYNNGNLHGAVKHFDFFGNLQLLIPYNHGEINGMVEEWHKNQQKKNETFYINGERCGPHRTWDDKGKLTENKFYLEDNSLYYDFIPVSYAVFEKNSDKNARMDTLEKLKKARKHGLKSAAKHIARKFHTERSNVLRLTALRFNNHHR